MIMDVDRKIELGSIQYMNLIFDVAGEISVPFHVVEISEIFKVFQGNAN